MFSIDTSIFEFIYNLPHPAFLNAFFIAVSALAHPKLIFIPLVICFLLLHHKKLGWIIFEAVMASGFAAVFSQSLKYLFNRPRPFEALDSASSLDVMALGSAFPSVHSAFAFAIAFVLAANTKKPVYKILWFSYAFLTAVSRIWLGVHYPLDVICGAVIGTMFGLLSIKFTPILYRSLTHHKLR